MKQRKPTTIGRSTTRESKARQAVRNFQRAPDTATAATLVPVGIGAGLALLVGLIVNFHYVEEEFVYAMDKLSHLGDGPAPRPPPHALPAGWTRHTDANGQEYFFHAATGTSRWEQPTGAIMTGAESVKAHLGELDELLNLPLLNSSQSERKELLAEMKDLMTKPQSELRNPADMAWKVVSSSPRIYLLDNFLSAAECEFLKAQVSGRLEPAKVVQKTDQKFDLQTSLRNNEQIWLSQKEEREIPILRHILKRVHRMAHVPDEDAEALQIGRYSLGQKYELHLDSDPVHDVSRPATMIVYLNDVEQGGETIFALTPEAKKACKSSFHEDVPGDQRFGVANCCEADSPQGGSKGLLRIAAKRGRAVLFFNHHASGKQDSSAEHAACPIIRGEKWIAQRWFRYKPYQNIVHGLDQRFDGVPLPQQERPAGTGAGYLEPRVLSNKAPRIYLFEDFLSTEEIQHLVQLRERLDVAETTEGGPERRWVTGDLELHDPVVAAVSKRMYRAALLQEGYGEPLQFTSYTEGGTHPFHIDSDPAHDATRPYSIIVYLTGEGKADEGGATVFPLSSGCVGQACCKAKVGNRGPHDPLIVPPKAGRAVLIGSHTLDAHLEPQSAHGACPAGRNGKLVLQRFFRMQSYTYMSAALSTDSAYDVEL